VVNSSTPILVNSSEPFDTDVTGIWSRHGSIVDEQVRKTLKPDVRPSAEMCHFLMPEHNTRLRP